MLFLQHYRPTFFLLLSSVQKESSNTLWIQRRGTITYASVLSVFLCVSEVPGVVSRSCMIRLILFAQNRKTSAKHPGRFLTFNLKIVEDVIVQPCISGLDLKSHFFFPPGNSSRGWGWRWEQRVGGVCWHDWGLCTWCLYCLNFDLLLNLMMWLVLEHDAHLLFWSDLWTQGLAEK